MRVLLPSGTAWVDSVCVSVGPRCRDVASRMLRGRANTDESQATELPLVSVPMLLSMLPNQTLNGQVQLPRFLEGSAGVVDAFSAAIEHATTLDGSLEVELALGRLMPTHFHQGVSESVLNLWHQATLPFLQERIGGWKFDAAENIQDFFFDACATCGGRDCGHTNTGPVTLRQRTTSAGTQIVQKQTLHHVDAQAVTWVDVSTVTEIVSPTLLGFPSWVKLHDVAFHLGPLVVSMTASGLEVASSSRCMQRLQGFQVPRPQPGTAPDCRLRISTETAVNVPNLLMPIRYIRKSRRESITQGPWTLVLYTVCSGKTEAEVSMHMVNGNVTHNVELELDIKRYVQERATYSDLVHRAAAVSMLKKLYNVFGHRMCSSGVGLLPVM